MNAGFQRRIINDQICVLTLDRPGSSANVFDDQTLRQFSQELDWIAGNTELRGLVIASAKPAIFVAGADLHFLAGNHSQQELEDYLAFGQAQIDRVARLTIPTAAAIHGASLGGGYELCLACDWRIASNAAVTRIGLPETTLGLIPAWGGTTRLPRLIGLDAALDVILGGNVLSAEEALRRGIVDEVVAPDQLIEAACKKILTSGKSSRASPAEKHSPAEVLEERRAAIGKQQNPALAAAVEVAVQASEKTMEQGLLLERQTLLRLLETESTRNLLWLFIARERAKKIDRAGIPVPQQIAVIGAGTMGAGIAYWASSRGLRVTLHDVDEKALARGLNRIAVLYEQAARRNAMTPEESRAGLERIRTGEGDLAKAELVIEAVAEQMDVKRQVFRDLENRVSRTTLLASNTSALSISEIAEELSSPERVVGLHFFNPVHRMALVEVSQGRATSPLVLRQARIFVQRIGKLPVVVRDRPGFVVNRILFPYLIEAIRLVDSGAPLEEIDAAMVGFGMPMGPLRLLDEVGTDVALQIARTLERHFGERARAPEILAQLVQAGQLGRKSGRGFYDYKGAIGATPVVKGPESHQAEGPWERPALAEQMLMSMINEAFRCAEESIVTAADQIDFAMVIGAGFPAGYGGPIRYAESLSLARVLEILNRLSDQHGDRFKPCELLRTLAERGETISRGKHPERDIL